MLCQTKLSRGGSNRDERYSIPSLGPQAWVVEKIHTRHLARGWDIESSLSTAPTSAAFVWRTIRRFWEIGASSHQGKGKNKILLYTTSLSPIVATSNYSAACLETEFNLPLHIHPLPIVDRAILPSPKSIPHQKTRCATSSSLAPEMLGQHLLRNEFTPPM